MKFVTFIDEDREPRPGVVFEDGRVLDLREASRLSGHGAGPRSVLEIIRSIDGVDFIRSLIASADHEAMLEGRNVRFLAPMGENLSKNIFCVGRNYLEHVKEGYRARSTDMKLPEAPQFFTKPPTSVIGPTDEVPAHEHVTQMLDYEVELAIVIGEGGRDISTEDAFRHVFGYTILNDLTARDLQRTHDQWFKGKGLDGHCVMGPWIAHRSVVPDVTKLMLSLSVNGEERQRAQVDQMIFDIPTIVSQLSAGMTLEAGDVIATGTPHGVGFAMSPQRFLNPGDVVEAAISGLGRQRNEIKSRSDMAPPAKKLLLRLLGAS
jgi:2-keto-4-pentenoate hydratase/2-oxohepta-3-ene-1,7-dioic acid hydratase in catechol pathway